jgi:hypothetical protein
MKGKPRFQDRAGRRHGMKKTQEEKAWDSLNKEYLYFHRLATRENAPEVERRYYGNMASRTLAQRDSIRLPRKRDKGGGN